jgi:hypothetical protein
MKTNSFFRKAVIVILSATLFIACSKTGPAGPKGDKGDTGATGEKGDTGAQGNANVKVYTKDISGATWTTVGSSSNGYLELKIDAPDVLTEEVVNNWVVLVYVQSTDFNGWALLPYYTNRDIQVSAKISVGFLLLDRTQDGKPQTQSNFYGVKLVLIEPSLTGNISLHPASLPDFKDYHAVCKYYGIPE